MATKSYKIETIDLVNLEISLQNPRFEQQDSQREAKSKLINELGIKLINLADDIARFGLDPSVMPMVVKSKEKNQYSVLEGNRRVAAIQFATDPSFLDTLDIPASITKRFKSINAKYGSNLPLSISCVVFASRKEANKWIELRHTGQNNGVGVIPWNGIDAARFRGDSPEQQLIEYVKDSEFLDQETTDKLSKIYVTNLERLLGSPEARRTIGINVQRKQLTFLNLDNRDEVIARLAIIVSDIANKYVKVTQLKTREQRISYADAVVARKLPTPGTKISATDIEVDPKPKPTKTKTKKKKRASTTRTTLIPRTLNLNITQPRIEKIYEELQKLQIETYVNSSAVLLRVFLEMSLNEFADVNGIKLMKITTRKGTKHVRNMTLKETVVCVVKFLVKREPSCKSELHGISTLAGSRDTIFSIKNWQEYVHNRHYTPIATDLKTIWDNIQPLFVKLWA